jgi:hypothetical protein
MIAAVIGGLATGVLVCWWALFSRKVTLIVTELATRPVIDHNLSGGVLVSVGKNTGFFVRDPAGKEYRVTQAVFKSIKLGEVVSLRQFGNMWRLVDKRRKGQL